MDATLQGICQPRLSFKVQLGHDFRARFRQAMFVFIERVHGLLKDLGLLMPFAVTVFPPAHGFKLDALKADSSCWHEPAPWFARCIFYIGAVELFANFEGVFGRQW